MHTFAFELSFLRNEEEREGWLFGEKYYNTEYYILGWVWADLPFCYENGFIKTKMDDFDYESIEEIELMIIKKEDVRKLSEEYGINKETAVSESKNMREKNMKPKSLTNQKYPRLHYTSGLDEKPVNLVVGGNDLKQMSIFTTTIRKTSSFVQRICRLFNEGYNVSQISDKTELPRTFIMNYLCNGAKNGVLHPVSSFLSKDKEKEIHKAIKKNDNDKLSHIREYLDNQLGKNKISSNEIRQYIIASHSN